MNGSSGRPSGATTTKWQTPTLLQRCRRRRRWWPARKTKQLGAVVVVVVVEANGPVVTSLRPRWCQRLAIAAVVAAASVAAVATGPVVHLRRCAPNHPPTTKHLQQPETSRNIITPSDTAIVVVHDEL